MCEDEEELVETLMESSLTDREEIIEVQDAEFKNEELDLSQPFAIIEDIPVFF